MSDDGVSKEEIAGLREPDADLLEAVGALVERDRNHGDWPSGVPECFSRIAERIGVLLNNGDWVIVVESWVKRRALEELLVSREEITSLRRRLKLMCGMIHHIRKNGEVPGSE